MVPAGPLVKQNGCRSSNIMGSLAKLSTPIIFVFKNYSSLLSTLAEEKYKQINYMTSNEHFLLNLPVNFEIILLTT